MCQTTYRLVIFLSRIFFRSKILDPVFRVTPIFLKSPLSYLNIVEMAAKMMKQVHFDFKILFQIYLFTSLEKYPSVTCFSVVV